MSAPRNVTATFNYLGNGPRSRLSVAALGPGSGKVNGPGLDCTECSTTVLTGTPVTLVATPNAGSVFGRWTGACTGTNPSCTVTVTQDLATVANFDVAPAGGTQALTVVTGWNLLGNGLNVAISPAALGNANQVQSVWKWLSSSGKWAFYSPLLSTAELAAFAQSKGYDVLTSIGANEGFWLNAARAGSVHSATGTPQTVVLNTLPNGWSLLSTGATQTPAQINASSTRQPGVISLWAWEPNVQKWLFYAPTLASQGGTVLLDYANSQGYLDFTASGRSLGLGTGFWLNRPAP